jgi:hypothetical protein
MWEHKSSAAVENSMARNHNTRFCDPDPLVMPCSSENYRETQNKDPLLNNTLFPTCTTHTISTPAEPADQGLFKWQVIIEFHFYTQL